MSRTGLGTLIPIILSLTPAVPAAAQEGLEALCPLLLQERQAELDDLELAIRLDETQLKLAEELFSFQDGLWKEDMTERLVYLTAKHHRDLAQASLERSKKRLERQKAVLDQYQLVCGPTAQRMTAQERQQAIDKAQERYLVADCRVRALDVKVIEVNMEHHEENLKSANNLRRDAIASREQVMFAERDVEMMTKELEHAKKRATGCPLDG